MSHFDSSKNIPLNQMLAERDDEHDLYEYDLEEQPIQLAPVEPAPPALCGVPLKYISLVTLAVQNSLLTIIMHYSRVSASSQSRAYSAATAVLMNELLKGGISLAIAFFRIDVSQIDNGVSAGSLRCLLYRSRRLTREVFSADCWKLSIPAILYVIQNNLQYVAASNLDAATFQVTYQMKILTTAAFSVVLLRKKLSSVQWMALLFLAIGVGIVQIQTGAPASHVVDLRSMEPIKGFMAVFAACFTSGLAGVYFEMVLKNSQADLWVRNVQLSAFSLLPALVPIFFTVSSSTSGQSWFQELFHDFGAWAWATVSIQVLGGLITAMVIKYADNIMKGFATSLSIVISFLASVALFDFEMTVTFVLGSSVVLVATWLYNQPAKGTATTAREKPRCTTLSLNEKWAAYGPATTATMVAPALSRSTSASRVTVTSTSRTVSNASLSSLSSFDRDELTSGRTSVDSSDDEDDIKKATRWNVSAATLPALMSLRRTSL